MTGPSRGPARVGGPFLDARGETSWTMSAA